MSLSEANPFTFIVRVGGKTRTEVTGCSPNWSSRFTVKGWRAIWWVFRHGYLIEVETRGPEKYDPKELMDRAFEDDEDAEVRA